MSNWGYTTTSIYSSGRAEADTLHVSCAAEGAYVAHSAAMLHSVLTNRGELRVHVHYLHGPCMDADDMSRLARMVESDGCALTFLEVPDSRVKDLPDSGRFTAAMWHRLFLAELAPDLRRVLYLDVDTVACAPLAELWRVDLGNDWLAAVTNAFQPNHRVRPKHLGLPGREVYFNSGVLLLDLERMRTDRVPGALLEVIRRRGPELEWPDQDALNLVMHDHRTALAPRWNAMNALYRHWSRDSYGALARRRARWRPAIRHFEGPGANKPWHPDCTEPYRELYWHHLRQTPWAELASSA